MSVGVSLHVYVWGMGRERKSRKKRGREDSNLLNVYLLEKRKGMREKQRQDCNEKKVGKKEVNK